MRERPGTCPATTSAEPSARVVAGRPRPVFALSTTSPSRTPCAPIPRSRPLAVEDLGFSHHTDRGPSANRRLARWAKGQLQRDLERLSEANGVGLKVVNAAYSSQACPACSWTERANRSGPAFRCRRCGTAGSSDAVAASNLRSRASDPEITRFAPATLVRQVLLRRAAERAEALGLQLESEDHGAAPGMTTARHATESPVPNAV
jgi:hypothetical protein